MYEISITEQPIKIHMLQTHSSIHALSLSQRGRQKFSFNSRCLLQQK